MADISMCSGEHCPVKNDCYRYTAKPDPEWQSYIERCYDFDKQSCHAFMSNKY